MLMRHLRPERVKVHDRWIEHEHRTDERGRCPPRVVEALFRITRGKTGMMRRRGDADMTVLLYAIDIRTVALVPVEQLRCGPEHLCEPFIESSFNTVCRLDHSDRVSIERSRGHHDRKPNTKPRSMSIVIATIGPPRASEPNGAAIEAGS